MTKEEVLIKKLEEASDAYYNTDKVLMTDEEFDSLVSEAKSMGLLIPVGAKPKEGKNTVDVSHNYSELVGTLDKLNYVFEKDVTDETKKSAEEWLRNSISKLKDLSLKSVNLIYSFKFDGNSVVIEYHDGKVYKALTRGRDGKGVDLTHVFKDHTIKNKGNVAIKYEIIINWDNFNKLLEETKTSYANPRSLVSGKLNDKDAYNYYKYMTLVPLWIKDEAEEMTRNDEIDFILENFGSENELFRDCRIIELELNNTEESINFVLDELNEMYELYTSERANLPYMIDGLVIEFVEKEVRDILGSTGSEPKWATALKFPYFETKTKITGFDYTLGDSGVITARAWFEPVKFMGTVHNKQSLQNLRRFNELGLGIGSEINVAYRNDCLTYITPIDSEYNSKIEPEPFIKECPVCGGEVIATETGAFAKCNNELCTGKALGRIQNYLIKMDIKGIKMSTLEKIHKEGMLDKIEDLYSLDFDKVASIEGLGDITAMHIISSMMNKIPYDYEILGSLGIQGVSTSKAKDLCAKITLADLFHKTTIISDEGFSHFYNEVISVEGFNDKSARAIYDALINDFELVSFLMKRNFVEYKQEADKLSNIQKLKVVFTDFRNEALQYHIEKLGHKVTGGVSKKTDYVVTPKPDGTTVKIKKAKELGIEILTVEQFKVMVGFEG